MNNFESFNSPDAATTPEPSQWDSLAELADQTPTPSPTSSESLDMAEDASYNDYNTSTVESAEQDNLDDASNNQDVSSTAEFNTFYSPNATSVDDPGDGGGFQGSNMTPNTAQKHVHDHTPSRSSLFLKNQAIAKEQGQEAVERNGVLEKLDINPDNAWIKIDEMADKGVSPEMILGAIGDAAWLKIGELAQVGVSPDEILGAVGDAAWLKIGELAQIGVAPDKILEKLSPNAARIKADELRAIGVSQDALDSKINTPPAAA
jgi:hypothetical protein